MRLPLTSVLIAIHSPLKRELLQVPVLPGGNLRESLPPWPRAGLIMYCKYWVSVTLPPRCVANTGSQRHRVLSSSFFPLISVLTVILSAYQRADRHSFPCRAPPAEHARNVPGCSWLLFAALACSCPLLAPPGRSGLFLAAPDCWCLLLAAHDCFKLLLAQLLLAALGCS